MGNGLYREILAKLGECKSSIRVRLAKNYLKGLIPVGFFNLPSNTMLELNDNALSEELPTLIVGDVLCKLDLSNNLMSGPIPSAIDKLPTLQTLSLDSNRFSGAIPPEVGQLKNLWKLDLSGNNLTGEISEDLTRCTSRSRGPQPEPIKRRDSKGGHGAPKPQHL
ncbi:hypothetical protein ZIOFF_057767 [Zingiber officinale]|uniref:Uncharacterized protein n=1 Tax=Zingiber officinale TaxID=94328 RepID=A0A8J5KIQ8_ZINOF|nr:hypothetical protein ZIOFF_057767 [Zingiber officinale]